MKSLKKRILPFAMTAAVMGATMVMGNIATPAHAMNPCEGLSGCSTSGAFSDDDNAIYYGYGYTEPMKEHREHEACFDSHRDDCVAKKCVPSEGDAATKCVESCDREAHSQCT